jgi:phage gp37-like protein
MTLEESDYAWMAKASYTDPTPEQIGHERLRLNGHLYEVFAYAENTSGFHGVAFRQVDSPHAVVIAYRGTDLDFKNHTLTGVQDVAVDAVMVADRLNPQEADARRFTQQVLDKAQTQGISRHLVTVTGHSKGGTLAQIEAWRFGLHGQTFNAYGAVELTLGVPEGGSQVINNVLATDPVSGCGRHFGQVRTYATQADIASLRQAGYLDGKSRPLAAVSGMRLAGHGIDNFAPDRGPSVLTAEGEARATQYAEAIDAFRRDAAAVRAGLHGSTLFPQSATWSVARLTEATEVATTLGLHAKAQGGRMAQAAVDGAARAWHVAQAVVEHAGEAASGAARELQREWQGMVLGPAHAPAGDRPALAPAGMFPAAASASAAPWTPAPLLDDPDHPAHPMFVSASDGVARMEAHHGLPCGPHSSCVAGALTAAAQPAGLLRIDSVQLSVDRSKVVAVQGDLHSPFRRLAAVDTVQAAHTPLERSSADALTLQRLPADRLPVQREPMAVAVEPAQTPMR